MIDIKEEFAAEPEAKEFADLIDRKAFKKGVAYAFARLASSLSAAREDTRDANSAKLEGARLMVTALQSLVEPERTHKPPVKTLKPTP